MNMKNTMVPARPLGAVLVHLAVSCCKMATQIVDFSSPSTGIQTIKDSSPKQMDKYH